MSDTLGRIVIPDVVPSGVFPLRTDFGHGRARKRDVIVHQFGSTSGKVEQRFFVGPAATRYTFVRRGVTNTERRALAAFWDAQLGPAGAFSYDVPQEDQTFVRKTVSFEDAPLSFEDLTNSLASVGLTFVEIVDPASAPVYSISSTSTRFPSSTLASALLDQVQDIIPLVRIRVVESAVPDIFLSDRRVTVGGNLYLPRLLRIGQQGSSDVLVSQSIDGRSDDVSLTFGNADRVMVKCANDTNLVKAHLELSFFHVGTQIKLDVWAGELMSWNSNAGPEFSVKASDIATALTLQSPVRNISRSCWKPYADAAHGCPVDKTMDTRDLVHFPSADMSWCDLGYDTPNGCLAHVQAIQYFGGVQVSPQQVKIADNSTGSLFGIGRDIVTPTSQINDSIWGGTLPEIWHDDDGIPQRGMPVQCRIAAARDESDFVVALGIVGRGPIGAFTTAQMVDTDADGIAETFVGSTLDGQMHHGFKTTNSSGAYSDSGFGLRQVAGADPAGSSDYFSLGRVGTTTTSWREVVGGGSVYEKNYAAGISFLEIRRTDQKGIQLTAVASHQMQAMISKGLTGLVWTSPGSRTTAAGCTNPFWVAVNTLLRSMAVDSLTSTVQESYFDVAAAINAAAIADTTVASIFGGGTEKQFRFKGTIDTRKALRDRLQEILNNGCGYFTWSFGRLRLGIRSDATAVTSFSAGNMLFGSLEINPINPGFEKSTMEFADEEYLFAKNTVDYTDQDHALRNGRVDNPLNSQLGLIGSSTKSQAMRIAVIRTREELGGVGITEQTIAREINWRTTILALDTEAGQVTRVSDPDLPNGQGKFRNQTLQIHRDYSVSINARTVTDSMYDLTTGQLPAAVSEAAQPQQAARDTNVPPAPTFSARIAGDDPTSAEVYGLSLASTVDVRTVTAGTFKFAYFDATAAQPTITATISGTAASLAVSSATGISSGTYLQIGTEIVLCGTPSGLTIPITARAQLGTTAAGHMSGATANILKVKPIGAVFPYDFFSSASLSSWTLRAYLPGQTVVAISGYVTNAYGDSTAYNLPVNLVLAPLPKTLTPVAGQVVTGYDATTGTYSSTPLSVPTFIDNETPTGTMNGSNQTFTLAYTPNPASSLSLYLNGELMRQGTGKDYTISGSTITYLTAKPDTAKNDTHVAFYRK